MIAKYMEMLEKADSINKLKEIVEEASFDDNISNDEYEMVYNRAIEVAQSWRGF